VSEEFDNFMSVPDPSSGIIFHQRPLGVPKDDKGSDLRRAKQLFPDLKLDRVKDHGKADAILICEYGRRILK
jgi:hypothetical protein